MGLVCGCTDKSTRQGTKNIIGANEGGEASDNSMIYNEPKRPMILCKDMHFKNNEYM